MPAIVSPALASGSKSGVGPASPAFNPGNSASLHVQNALAQSEDLLGLADTVLNMNASVQHLSLHLEAIRSVAASLPRSETSESAVSTTEQLEILQSLSRDHAAIYAHAAKLKLITESPEAILANLETSSALRSRRGTIARPGAGADGRSDMLSPHGSVSAPVSSADHLSQNSHPDRSEPAIIVLRSAVNAYALAMLHTVRTFMLAPVRQSILSGADHQREKGGKGGSAQQASLYHVLLSALSAGSAHSASSSFGSRHAKASVPISPSQQEVLSYLQAWTERARSAMLARASLNPSSSFKAHSTRTSVYSSTLARITTLDEAARAEISLLSTFRRFETLTKRVLQAPISSSASVHPMIQEATQLVHVALSELKAQLLGQLHGRVQQLLQEEIDGFSRTVRAVLEGGLRALHEPGQRAAPQPESAPLDFLLGDMPLAASAGDTSIDSATAFDHSRALNENLRNRLDGGSVLLNAVAVTVGNAASRLGARVNAWASGLRQVYEKLGNATAASKEAATSSTDSGLERITELTKLYRSSAQSAVETLLDELVKQITWQDTGRTSHHDETDNERRQRVSAQAVFSYKVVDRLLKTRAVLSALSIQASSRPETAAADEDARRLEGALQRTRQRCLQSWHDIAVDRALAEFAFASTSEEDGGKSEAGTSAPGEGAGSTPPYALLRAMESLKQSVYELGGLSRARTGGDDLGGQKPLLSALLARLGSEPQELELVKASQVKAATRWLSSRDIDERLSDPAAGLF